MTPHTWQVIGQIVKLEACAESWSQVACSQLDHELLLKAEPERARNTRRFFVGQLAVKVTHKPSNEGVHFDQGEIAADACSRTVAELDES